MGSSVILPPTGQPKTGPDPSFSTPSIPNAVSFSFSGIAPPASLYVQKDDTLEMFAITNQPTDVVTYRVRFLRLEVPIGGQPDHPAQTNYPGGLPVLGTIIIFERSIQLGAPRVFGSAYQQLGEGFILSLTAVGATATGRGQTFARAELVRSPQVQNLQVQDLLSDYVDNGSAIAWPGGNYRHPSESTGWTHSVQVTNPGAGADWSFVVPTRGRMRLISLNAVLTTSAAVANRAPTYIVDDGLNTVGVFGINANIAASIAANITGTAGNFNGTVAPNLFGISVPDLMMLPAGWHLRSLTSAIQAADQWSSIFLNVEEWLDF